MKPLNYIKPFLVLMSYFCFTGLFAQNLNSKIDNYLNEIGNLHQLNGNLLLAVNGRVIANRTFGFADFVTQKPNTIDVHFNICSISKIFTSTAILQLRDKNKLSLDDSLSKYFQGFPFPGITLRHLLTHTSGLPNLELFEDLVKTYPDTVITNKDILPELRKWKKGLYFKAGDEFRYNNVGYNLLSMVVEKVSGLSFSDFLEKNIFKPSGMNKTYLSVYQNHSFQRDIQCVKMHVQLHPYYDNTYSYADSLSAYKFTNYNYTGTAGSSNIITTTADLLKFDKAFFDGRLLKPSSMEEAFTPVKLNNGMISYKQMDTMLGEGKMGYGLGWDIFELPGFGKSVGHGGFMFGNATFYFHNLQNRQTIIAFDNASVSEFGRIITSAFYLLNGKEPMVIRNHHSLAFVYGSTLVKEGPDAAACAFNEVKSDTAHYYISEWEFNQLGGNLLYRSSFEGHLSMALEVFKINTLLFPDSYNTYDSYAEGLKSNGKIKEAISMYRKSIVLNPKNEDGKINLEELLKK